MLRFLLLISLTILHTLTLAGCAIRHSFNRDALRDQVGLDQQQLQLQNLTTDPEIKDLIDRRAQLPNPSRIAVYFKRPERAAGKLWGWTDSDKAQIEGIAKELQVQGVKSEIFFILDSLIENESLCALRRVAAQHGADALLVLTGAGSLHRYTNWKGLSYALIAPAFFVEGSEVEGLFLMNAVLLDVRNEFLYLTAESEGKFAERYVAAYGLSNKEIYHRAKTESLGKLRDGLAQIINDSTIKGIPTNEFKKGPASVAWRCGVL
jgi:hypothetical protein